jgi:hypothetical protein
MKRRRRMRKSPMLKRMKKSCLKKNLNGSTNSELSARAGLDYLARAKILLKAKSLRESYSTLKSIQLRMSLWALNISSSE